MPDWLKVINYQYHHVRLFGWLIGVEENGRVRPAGMIEFPPSEHVRKAIRSFLDHAKTGEDRSYIYLRPDIRMIVKSRGWTTHSMLRTPVFHSFDFGDAISPPLPENPKSGSPQAFCEVLI